MKAIYKIGVLVRTADLKKRISKAYTTNWSDKVLKNTEIHNVPIPSYRIDNLPERYNGALLKTRKLTFKENEVVMKALGLC